MTTIAYNHKDKTISCDGRITSDSFIDTDTQIKMIRIEGVYWFYSGRESHKEKFFNEFEFGEKTEFEFDCAAFRYENSKLSICFVCDGVFDCNEVLTNDAIGSGSRLAMSAMDFGKDATESVEYAKTRDIYTGGVVNTYKLDELIN